MRTGMLRRGGHLAIVAALVIVAAGLVATQAGAALSLANPPAFSFVNDENGADDQPGQKDLNAQAVAVPSPGDLWVAWKWDDTSLSGGNTGDACALFDTDTDARVNFAICVTIQGNPAVQATFSPRVYTCGDGKVDRCTSTYAQVSQINSACTAQTNATDPFHNNKKDTQATCRIDLNDVGGAGTANLINTCSYPSQQPTSAPSDCVLIPRDAFVRITKVADPATGSFPFRLGVQGETQNVVFTASGSQTSDFIAIRSDRAYNLKEDVPANWAIDGTPSCTGASGSNGTFSGDTIAGIRAAADNVIECTFRDRQLTGAIEITKQRSGTTTKLAGAEFSIDGSGPHTTGSQGTVCVAGLSLGTHTVAETRAPDGHGAPSSASQNVEITGAGTCASGATPVTFENPLVLGTINIHKTGAGGAALEGATFTLYTNAAPTAGPRGGSDAATSLACITDASGDCTIASVPLGDYWIVETGVPAGYVAMADQAVTIDLGTSPGNGDTESFSFTNTPAAGRIDIQKTGLGGAALEGATFELYFDNGINAGDPQAVRGLEDTTTGKTCITNELGRCSFTGVAPGDYWVVETVVPAGYSKADEEQVDVPLGATSGQGATVALTIADPVVPGTVEIQKYGLGGSELAGAAFTLYADNAPKGGTRGDEDTVLAAKTCTTGLDGKCSIGGVAPGDYWVVETTVPDGYDPAPDQLVEVGIGAAADAGDTDSLSFTDPAVDGKVSITKTDDADNPLGGAEFTLYTDAAPVGGTRDDTNPDPITSPALKCTTDPDGKCDISGVPPGDYWLVETVTPAHHDPAADQAITVGLGDAPRTGDTVTATPVNERKHRVVVIVCHEGTDTLYPRDVTVGAITKQSLGAGALTEAQQKALCDTGGASFGDISGHGDVTPTIKLGPGH